MLRRRPASSPVPNSDVDRAADAAGSHASSEKKKVDIGIKFVTALEDGVDAIAANVVPIVNHRGYDLWFTMPGQQVECSKCESLYPQVFGRLCGAEGRSQMSQTDFICINCIAAEQGDAPGEGWQEMMMQAEEQEFGS